MLRRFFSDASLYASSALVSRGIGLLLLPLFTRHLSPAEYGMIEMLVLASALLNLLLPLEVSQAVARLMPEAKTPADRRGYASTAFWFTAAGFLAFAAVVWIVPRHAAALLFGSDEHATVARLGAIAISGNALVYVLQNQLRWNLQPRASVAVALSHAALFALVSATLIAGFDAGVMGFVWGQAAGSAVGIVMGLALTRVPVTAAPDSRKLREMLGFSAPLVLSGAAVYLSQYFDRWMLGTWLGLGDVGIYGAASRIASAMSLLVAGFQMALVPLVYRHHRDPGAPLFVARVFTWYLACACALIGFLAAFAGELTRLLTGPGFDGAGALVVWLALAQLAMGLYFFAPGMGLAKKTAAIAAVNVIAAAVNVLLNVAWIPSMGTLGAALATLSGGMTMAALYFFVSRRYYFIPYPAARIAVAAVLLAAHVGLVLTVPLPFVARLASWVGFGALAAGVLIGFRRDSEPAGRLLPGQ